MYRRQCGCILPWRILVLLLATAVGASSSSSSPSSSSETSGMVLRVRTLNGAMERLQIPSGAEDTMSLKEALSVLLADSTTRTKDQEGEQGSIIIKIGSSTIDDASQTLSSLGLKQGSLVSLLRKSSTQQQHKPKLERGSHFAAKNRKVSNRWDPFPDLAKDYESAMKKTKTKRNSRSGMSYGDLANLQSSLHVVEPQQEGPVKRFYMCAKSGERFRNNCLKKGGNNKSKKKNNNNNEYGCRVALLLGTIQRERVDTIKPSRARTSLSSQTESSQYCDVIKVHALWEPSRQNPAPKQYDAQSLLVDFKSDTDMQRVLRVSQLLGLRPVGWAFTYNDNRHEQEDPLAVYAPDAKTGALLQIANMKNIGRTDGSRFATLAMDLSTGAGEAFQLSDVCVQMVAEDLWEENNINNDSNNNEASRSRFVPTKHGVIVDGKETKELDSMLCLINTAILMGEGSFSGPTFNSVNKRGGISNKVKKAILAALDSNNDNKLLETLCDFNLLLSLDKTLSSTDTDEICGLVRKWARGQKRGTELNDRLKMLLRSILGH